MRKLKLLLTGALLLLVGATAFAQYPTAVRNVSSGMPALMIENRVQGSGTPSNLPQDLRPPEPLQPVGDLGVMHAPQVLMGHPTAATIWPRVIDVQCHPNAVCDGYNTLPSMGRSEYLFVRPIPAPEPPLPVVVEAPPPVPLLTPLPPAKPVFKPRKPKPKPRFICRRV